MFFDYPPKLVLYRKYDNVNLPKKGTEDSACYDLYAHLTAHEDDRDESLLTLHPFEPVLVPTGLHAVIDKGWQMKIFARSGWALRGVALANGVGVIDADYRDEIFIPLVNLTDSYIRVNHGDRVAQFQLEPVHRIIVSECLTMPKKEERTGGFGSTGK